MRSILLLVIVGLLFPGSHAGGARVDVPCETPDPSFDVQLYIQIDETPANTCPGYHQATWFVDWVDPDPSCGSVFVVRPPGQPYTLDSSPPFGLVGKSPACFDDIQPTLDSFDGIRIQDGLNNENCSISLPCQVSDEWCSNGVLDPGEVCDDGNLQSGDGCNSTCTSDETCGNGIQDPGEECDDGNTDRFDGCTNNCTSFTCVGQTRRVSVETVMDFPGGVVPPEGERDCTSDHQSNLDDCPGTTADIDSDGTLDCLLMTGSDKLGTTVEQWCVSGSGSPHLLGTLDNDPDAEWGTCGFKWGENEQSFVIRESVQDGQVDCILSAHWLNQELIDGNGVLSEDPRPQFQNGKRDQVFFSYFLTQEQQPPPVVRWEHYQRNSPPVLVSSGTVSLGSPLPFSGGTEPGGSMTVELAQEVCDLDDDADCDVSDESIFELALGSCIGDAAFEPMADGDSDGCVAEPDRALIFGPSIPVFPVSWWGFAAISTVVLLASRRALRVRADRHA